MTNDAFGQLCSLLAAFTWAMALVFFKKCGETISPIALNLFKNVVGMILLVVTLIAIGESTDTLRRFPVSELILLSFSGMLGITVADTLFFHALNRVGVGLVTIVECAYSPFVILCAFLMLSERLTPLDYVGIAIIVSAIFVSSKHAPPPGRTRRELITGMLLGCLAMGLMAYGIVLAKPILEISGFPLIWATTIRLAAGTVALAMVAAASPQRRSHFAVFRPSRVWVMAIPGAVLGTYIAMILWVAGFKYTQASVAAILNQLSMIFAMILATVILKERLTIRKLCSVALALIGALLVTVDGATFVRLFRSIM